MVVVNPPCSPGDFGGFGIGPYVTFKSKRMWGVEGSISCLRSASKLLNDCHTPYR